jgi:hypothetical protein
MTTMTRRAKENCGVRGGCQEPWWLWRWWRPLFIPPATAIDAVAEASEATTDDIDAAIDRRGEHGGSGIRE